ncbi:hypothetical protein [Cognatitamlana onchidii]|uniref:hypothetical protein n=1 Tax=Cognatitamlana onchidii TaxID=2562860 RepID=UPI0010A683D2|nr:hypothetical protein [Algibacter onchidii]
MTNNFRSKGLGYFILLMITLFGTAKVFAQSYETKEGDSINPRLYVTAGYYFPSINTSLRIDGRLGLGTEIGLEDLGLEEDKSVFKLGTVLRVSPKSQLAIAYTSINRDASAVLERDIVIGNTTFEAGSGLGFEFNVDYYALTWRYSFFNEKNWNAGLSLGARAVSIKTGFRARVNDRLFNENTSVTAPAILFGVHGGAYLTPKLLARYSLEYFYLSVNGIDISVIESNASVEYFFFKKFGLGLAYSTNDYLVRDVPIGEDFSGKIDFNFGGFNLFLSARF